MAVSYRTKVVLGIFLVLVLLLTALYPLFDTSGRDTVSVVAGNGNPVTGNIRTQHGYVYESTLIHVGPSPWGVVYDVQENRVYVSNDMSDNVSVIDPTTNTIVGNINVGHYPGAIAYDTEDNTLFVTNYGTNNVSVISASTDKVIATVNVGVRPDGIVYDSDQNTIYVANDGSMNITVIDGSTNRVTANLNNVIPSSAFMPTFWQLAYDSSENTVYVPIDASWSGNSIPDVVVIDATTNNVLTNVSLGPGSSPRSAASDFSNNTMFIGDYYGDNISVVNESTYKIVSNISVSQGCMGLVYDWKDNTIYASYYTGPDSFVEVINASSYSILATVPDHNGPFESTYDSADNTVYISDNPPGQSNVTMIRPVDTYSATFTESGLPPGTQWFVNVTNSTGFTFYGSSTSDSISINFTDGSYSYVAASSGRIYTPETGNGTFVVNGQQVSESITFRPVKFEIFFDETGLPAGTEWYVNITGQQSLHALSGSSIIANLTNGSYTYRISAQNRTYWNSTHGGIFNVTGANRTITSIFTGYDSNVVFEEKGLPRGTVWYVNITGQPSLQAQSGSGIYTSLGNGTYAYTVATQDKSYINATHGGNFTIVGTSRTILSNFSEIENSVTFSESGLPSGSGWYVNVTDASGNASSNYGESQYITFSVPNGTYSYRISSSISSYVPESGTGTFSVYGSSITESVAFLPVHYAVEFNESGLPAGGEWYLNVTDNSTGHTYHENSTGLSIAIDLTNGTYAFTVATSDHEYMDPSADGIFTVSGSQLYEKAVFRLVTFSVKVEESGLPSGAKWSLNVSASNEGTVGSSSGFVISLPNGTYSYLVSTSDKDFHANSSSFTVNGRGLQLNVHFREVMYRVTIVEKGLPSGTSWNITFDGKVYNVSGTTFTTLADNGTYSYSSSMKGYVITNGSGNITVSGGPSYTNIQFSGASSTTGSGSYLYYIAGGAFAAVAISVISMFLYKRKKG